MSLNIIKTGIMDTLQDAGRYGYAAAGINPGGAMDKYAAAIANFLVGNEKEQPVIELHFPAAQIIFQEPALIAICGADLSAAVHDELIPCWQPAMVKRNSVLHFQKWKWGARAYLAVHGGFKIEKWLGSYSTNLKAAAGGYFGRMLKKEDVIELSTTSLDVNTLIVSGQYSCAMGWGVYQPSVYANASDLLVLPGPEWNMLSESSKKIFTESSFTINQKSDRMGYLLNGPLLQLQDNTEMVSAGVDFGTIQLLPNGKLMILMADHQTTGGYPRIGNIIGAHLPKLAQLPLGGEIHFQFTDIHTAEQMLFSQMRDLNIIERSCLERINQLYARHRP
jgi:antagonist of KipI